MVDLSLLPFTFLHIHGGGVGGWGAVTMSAAVGFPDPQDRSGYSKVSRLHRTSGVPATPASGRASLCGTTVLHVCTVCVQCPGGCQGRKNPH